MSIAGFSTGGSLYGFTTFQEENPSDREHPRKLWAIDETEAEVVRRIYRLFDDGSHGYRGIADLLNREGIPAPRNNGQIDGGDGTWQASSGNDNWAHATGAVNGPYTDGLFAVFAGTPGTVTVDNSLGGVVSGGMQFATSGYVIQGQPITLAAGSNALRVGDGSEPGAGYVATVASALTGAGGIDKTDLGTLVLTGANTYTGGTIISAGKSHAAAAPFIISNHTPNTLCRTFIPPPRVPAARA